MPDKTKYNLIILGGGLAGLSLALQLNQRNTDISILIVEKRERPAKTAQHKVGESLSELAAYYFREVLGLRDYLSSHQLRKLGFRFFFSPENQANISERVELGSTIEDPFPSHQIDRGILENDLCVLLQQKGVEIIFGGLVKEVNEENKLKQIEVAKSGKRQSYWAEWVVDATGRRNFLRRKMGLSKEIDHHINAVWFRMNTQIDIDDWSQDESWKTYLTPGKRRLATNHLMGTGYWVWIIQLVSGCSSIGIVSDPRHHSLDSMSNFEKAVHWLSKHESQLASKLAEKKGSLLDFKLMKQLAFDSTKYYSADRWGLSGDSSAFLDPFYSPGADFIALSNCWLTDLILRDRKGEDISLRSMIFDYTHRQLLSGWKNLYKDKYPLFGNTQLMILKIVWDWGTYWAIPCLLFSNNAYTDINFLKTYANSSEKLGERFSRLNELMQELFLDWSKYEPDAVSHTRINIFDMDCLYEFHKALGKQIPAEDLPQKTAENLAILERLAMEIFRLIYREVHLHELPSHVDPYQISLHKQANELLHTENTVQPSLLDKQIEQDIRKFWILQQQTNPQLNAH